MKTLIIRNADNSLRTEIMADIFAKNSELTTAGFDTRFTSMNISSGYNDAMKALINLRETENSWVGIKQLVDGVSGLGLYLIDQGDANSSPVAQISTVTLTGSSGTATIAGVGLTKTATFTTNLTTSAANFVTAHAASFLAQGVTVTSSGAVLTFTGTAGFSFALVATNVTGNLAGTVAVTQVGKSVGEIEIVAP